MKLILGGAWKARAAATADDVSYAGQFGIYIEALRDVFGRDCGPIDWDTGEVTAATRVPIPDAELFKRQRR